MILVFMKTIEELQQQADSIKSELEALKKLAEATKEEKELKEKKKKELTDQIATITLELNNRIMLLKDKTDDFDIEELRKAKELLETLDGFSWELNSFQQNIVDQLSDWVSVAADKSTDIAQKVGDKMWIRDAEHKKMNWWKTAAWIWWAIGATWLFKTVKWWFSSNEKKESEENKEWFFNHGVGKWLKYAGVAIGWAFSIKWLLDYFNKDKSWRDPESTENPSDGVNLSWEKLQKENPERAQQATNIGTQVNECRSKQILQNTNGREENDMLGETTSTSDFVFDKAPWAIIAHMDAQYNSVSDMLDKDDYVMNTIQSSLNKPYYAVMERWEEKVNNILKPLSGIVSGIPVSLWWWDGKLTAEGKAELAKPNPERDQQLHNIFAKYMRVKTWYSLKIQQLREKLAKDELWPNATVWDVEDYLDDDTKRKVIDAKIESQFLNLKLIDAAQFLTQQWISNDTLPENMKEVITDINDEYRKYHTIEIEKVLQKNENPTTHKEWLTKSCNEFIAHLTDPAVSRNMVTGLWHTLWVDIRANNTWADIDAIAKQMWFDQIVSWYQKDVTDISLKIANGTATKEDIQHLHDLMESFRMLQIEITLGGMVKNESDGQGWFVDKIVTRFGERTLGIVKDEEWNRNWKTIAFAWWIYLFRKPLWFVMKPVAKASWNTLKFVWRTPMMSGTLRWLANRIPTWSYMRSLKYRWKIDRLVEDIANKKISLEQARHVYSAVRGDISQTKSFDKLIKSEFGWKTVAQLESELKAGKNVMPKTSKIEAQKLAWSVIEQSKKWLNNAIEGLNKEYKVFLKNGKLPTDKLAEYKTKLDKIITSHNSTIYKQEKNILKQLKKLTIAERKALYESDKVIKNVVDANGGMKLLTATKRWRMMRIGLYAVMWTWQWWSALADWKGWRYATKEVADFWFGMVPVAGDLYDITMAIRWKDLNGNDMSTSERWVRWWLWLVCGVVNVFSFGLWGTAIKATVKWWTKLVAKAAAKEATEVAVKLTAKEALAKWMSKELLEQWLKQFGKKALLNWTLVLWWLWIIEWADVMMKEESLDDEPKTLPLPQNTTTNKQAA